MTPSPPTHPLSGEVLASKPFLGEPSCFPQSSGRVRSSGLSPYPEKAAPLCRKQRRFFL